jgi:hypothetical protein
MGGLAVSTVSLIIEDSLGVSLELLLSSLTSSDSLFSKRFAIASASFFLASVSYLAFCAFLIASKAAYLAV